MEELTKRERKALAKEKKLEAREKQAVYDKLKKLIIFAFGVFILIFVGAKVWNWLKTPTPQVAGEAVEIRDGDWIKGNESAKVVVLEYADFQCPACATYSSMLNTLLQEFPNDLLIAYRHFPLITIHKNALPSAYAAEAAGKQGKFWEMHDLLYEKQSEWSDQTDPKNKFIVYAKELELNEDIFISDYESGEIKDKVSSHLSQANSLRLNSTPSFFLNGEKVEPRSFEEFKSLVEKELVKE